MRGSDRWESGEARERVRRAASSEDMERLRAVLASIPDFVVVLDSYGSIVSVVAAECMPAIYRGISANEIAGRSILDFASPGSAATALEAVRAVFETGEKREIRDFVDLQTGRVHHEISLRAIRAGGGEVDSVLAVCRDVTEREVTTRSLRESEAQLAIAQRIAHLGSFALDLETGAHHWSEEACRIFHRDPTGSAPTMREFVSYVHPDDRQCLLQGYREARAGDRPLDLEYAVVLPDGSERVVHVRSELVVDESGRGGRFVGTVHDITERRQTEASLQQREEELRALLASLGKTPVVLFGIDGRMLSTFGTGKGFGDLGLVDSDVNDNLPADYLRPRDSDRILSFVREIVGTGEIRQLEHAFELPGGVFTFAMTGTPLRDATGTTTGVLTVVQNITAFRQAEAALAESEEKFSRVFSAAPSPMLILDAESGELLEVNDAFVRITGYTRDELSALRPVPGEFWSDLQRRAELFERVRRDGRFQGHETRFKAKSGREITAIVSAEAVVVGGRPCVIWQGVDVTDRIEAENERRAFQKRLVETQKLESLGVLTGGIAHDFNNLLVAIQGNAELALRAALPGGRTREILNEVREASRRAAELTAQLLAYTGKGQVEVLDIDLGALVRDTSTLLRSAVPRHSNMEIATEASAWVHADATQIRQVVMNLITNAAEALGPDGGEVKVRTGVFHVDASYLATCRFDEGLAPQTYAFFEVRDTGCGMDTETLRRIFEPFYTSKSTGRGLGLAAVIGIVRGHGGTLRVDSDPGRGTIFRVLLPAVASARLSPCEGETPDEHSDTARTVLLVDDEAAVRRVATRMLEGEGFRVLDAETGHAALETFRERKDEISVAVLDATMPGMNGAETFQGLRAIRGDLPVVFISGHSEEDVTRRIAGEKGVRFLKKPFTISALNTIVHDVLKG